jgi:hypothetical protein
VGYVNSVDGKAERLFELVKTNDLEGLVVKRKDGKIQAADQVVQSPKTQLLAKSRAARAVSVETTSR